MRTFAIRRAFRTYPRAIVTVVATSWFAILPHAVPFSTPDLYVYPPAGVTLAKAALVLNLCQLDNSPGVPWARWGAVSGVSIHMRDSHSRTGLALVLDRGYCPYLLLA